MMSWLWGKKKQQDVPEDQLKKKGFNPEELEIEKAPDDQLIADINSDYKGFIQPSKQQLALFVKNFKLNILIRCYPIDVQERHDLAYYKGGKICGDLKQVTKTRSIAKQVLKQIGRKILNGQFNLTKISFPIKAMFPKTSLQSTIITCKNEQPAVLFPIFIVRAAKLQDHYQRFKIAVTALLGYMYYANLFLKPLNPILGETLEAKYPDGTQIYCEQISHHPPISYFLIIGPEKLYRFWGYYNFEAKAGLNSLTLINNGKRYLQFHDGQKIQGTFANTVYSGAFIGTLRQQTVRGIQFIDKTNKFQCKITFGSLKKKLFQIIRPTDCFQSVISHKNKTRSKIKGSVLGYIDIDNDRYFDGRYILPIKPIILESVLQSDHLKRLDLQTLRDGKVQQAQIQKQRLQQIQRNDAKLRKNKN